MKNSPLLLEAKSHDLGGGFVVHRVFPQVSKRMVGPFAFFDHLGPLKILANKNTDVRPHPHIGLSTLTYLFDGRMVHRDSLGYTQTILPGEVNWMTAGKGISHSERAHEEDRNKERTIHGLQFWIALPDGQEDVDPNFQHYSKEQIPTLENAEYQLDLVAGAGFGMTSQVKTSSPLILANLKAKKAGSLAIEFRDFEIGLYLISGSAKCSGQDIQQHQILIFPESLKSEIQFSTDAHFIILGGKAFATTRHVWWNLVSSSRQKIEDAKQLWKSGKFPMVPGETEYIPAPD